MAGAEQQTNEHPGLDSARARVRMRVPSVAERVAEELRYQLAEGFLVPGAKLTEATVAEDLGVSRNTVREAFAELASERLLIRQPNRGVYVATLEPGDIHDVYTVRRAIEVSSIRAGGSPERIAAVRAAVEEGKRAAAANDNDGLGSANQHFHGAIVALAESARLNMVAVVHRRLARRETLRRQAGEVVRTGQDSGHAEQCGGAARGVDCTGPIPGLQACS